MFILKDNSELLHFLKGSRESFSKTFLLEIKKEYKNWCPFSNHGLKVDLNCYALYQYQTGWIEYLEHFILIIKYLTGDSRDAKQLLDLVSNLADPNQNSTKEKFENNLDQLVRAVQNTEQEIRPNLEQLTCLECKRLGESISCLESNCFIASTVMAASAVESRLHNLIKKKNNKIYKQFFQRSALGGLITLFDKNEYKDKKFSSLKKIVPDKHMSLLDLVNTYRIFSAHPLGHDMDYRIAETIINLSFLFLLDPELKIIDKKLLKHKQNN